MVFLTTSQKKKTLKEATLNEVEKPLSKIKTQASETDGIDSQNIDNSISPSDSLCHLHYK